MTMTDLPEFQTFGDPASQTFVLEGCQHYDLGKTLESGQAFRVEKVSMKGKPGYVIQDGMDTCWVRQGSGQDSCTIWLHCPTNSYFYWMNYLGLSPNEDRRCQDIDRINQVMSSDPFLAKVNQYSDGVFLLSQDPWQTLISFIISQRKSIPSIKTCLKRICNLCGTEDPISHYVSFPSVDRLSMLTESDLRACGLGYRAKYVFLTSQMVKNEGIDLLGYCIRENEKDVIYEALTRFPGVGKKVASCVMLFSLGYREVFPVDIWIERALALWGKTDTEVLEKYGNLSGLIQQRIYYAMLQTKGNI